MSSSIRLKKSSVAGTVPTTLEWGELAINTMDGRLYYRSSSDSQIHSLDETQTMACITAQAINKGEVVYASGGGGGSGKIEVSKYSASSTFGIDELYTLGLAGNSTTGTPNELVKVVTFGKLHQVVYDNVKQTGEVNTWAVGTVLYISATTTGKLTATIPAAPNIRIPIAMVVGVNGNNRTLTVRYEHGYHLNELHDVSAASPTDGQVLKWTAANNRWEAGTVSGGGGSGNSFTNIAVTGQTTVVADSSTDTLTLANGGGIDITTNATTDTVTFTLDNTVVRTNPAASASQQIDGDIIITNTTNPTYFLVGQGGGSGDVGIEVNGTTLTTWCNVYMGTGNFYGNTEDIGTSFTWYGSSLSIALQVNGTTGNVETAGLFSSSGNELKTSSSGTSISLQNVATLTTTATTANQVITSISGATYRTVKFLIQAVQGSNYETTEITAIHNGTTATHTEYGNIVIGSSVATFDVDYSSGVLRLLTTPTSASSTVFKVIVTSITV